MSWRTGRSRGSITVFLTLTLLLILALLATCLEHARVNVASAQAERALAGSLDATMTEYYKPLFDDYHILLMDKGIESDSLEYQKLSKQMKDYMEASLSTEGSKEMFGFIQKGKDLYVPQISSVEVTDVIRATDGKGKVLEDQILQYCKYAVPADGLRKMLEHVNLVEDSETTATIMKAESEATDKFEDANELLLELMEEVEGIRCKDGVSLNKDGTIHMQEHFAKKLCVQKVTKANVGITKEVVWKSAKKHYVNPLDALQELSDDLATLIQAKEEEEARKKAEEEEKAKATVAPKATAKPKQTNKSGQSKKKKKESATPSPSPTPTIAPTPKPTAYPFEQKIGECRMKQFALQSEVGKTKSKTEDAIQTIQKLKAEKIELTQTVSEYQKTVQEQQGKLHGETYASMAETVTQMQNDLGKLQAAIDLQPALEKNRDKLSALQKALDSDIANDKASLEQKKQLVDAQIASMQDYSIASLKFSYGRIEDKEAPNPMDILDSLGASVLELTAKDPNRLSKKTMENPDYYYKKYGGHGSGSTDVAINDDVTDGNLSRLFGTMGEVFGDSEKLEKVLSNGINVLLYQSYIKDNFKSYVSKESKFSKNPIEYEQEYILCGKKSDKKNLEKVVDRILLLRTVANFTYIMTDSGKKQKAYTAALALVGFTGIGALVKATEYAILAVWSYEEALVDVAALLRGKKVPLFKSRNTFMLKFSDVLSISRSKIQNKAKQLGKKSSGVAMGYEDYLQLFLLFETQAQKNYRTMDLIEANVKLRHSEAFSFSHSIYNLKVSCNYAIPAKFVALSFLSQWNYADSCWNFSKEESYSY